MAWCALNDATRVANEKDVPTPPRTGTLKDYAPLEHQHQHQPGSKFAVARKGRGRSVVAYFDLCLGSDPVVTDAISQLFAKEGNYVQDLVSEDQSTRIRCGQGIELSAP